MRYFASLFILVTIFVLPMQSQAQSSSFDIVLEPLEITGLGGLQSYTYGQHDGKWLVMGGRLDGLHRRQPFAAFDVAGHNIQLFVVDPVSQETWNAPLTSLSQSIQEQLSSTNMEFYQEGNYLYIVGGYGYSDTENDHTTFANLCAIDVPETINAIINGMDFTSHFRQISDPLFQVTGGRLQKINDIYHLVGGHMFLGRYNPMGPDHGPGFEQEYTDAIRKFEIIDDGTNLSVNHLPSFQDSENLHRRDYNVIPQILPNGDEGITAFSGVFQPIYDLPYLNAVNITNSDYSVDENFTQYYNHYHCANIPIYSENENNMNNLFFGGIAQFYDLDGELVQDNNVPFVKTIANVTRAADGTMAEYKLPLEMPGFLGAGSEFIPVNNIPTYQNEVIKFDELGNDTTLLGYIYGGINSSAENIFWINEGNLSTASGEILKVYLVKNETTGIHALNDQSAGQLKLDVYPNPGKELFHINFDLKQKSDVQITLHDLNGKKIEDKLFPDCEVGEFDYVKKIRKLYKGGVYILTVKTNYEEAKQRVVVEP